MNQQASNDQPVGAKPRMDRGKLIFLVIIASAMIAVYLSQQSGAELPAWPGDLQAALKQAKQEDRRVLLFLAGNPPSQNARNMSTKTLRKNTGKIESEKFITVLIQGKKTDELFKRYNVLMLPTFLLLDAEGKVLNRRVGFVGEMPFKQGFLGCTELKP